MFHCGMYDVHTKFHKTGKLTLLWCDKSTDGHKDAIKTFPEHIKIRKVDESQL
jgi:hypothetical protein